MKKTVSIFITLCIIILSSTTSYAWGVWGHEHIDKAAVLALPKDMGLFFYNHADYITVESTVPDLRKYTINDKAEPNRHYIDLEAYNYTTTAAMPQTMKEAIEKYGKDSLRKYGILPWYIQDMMKKLTTAFKEKKKTEILFIAADLGHYIGDAHMPLHTSLNHNGQLTGQQGIHAFWESQLPEQFGDSYNLYTGEAHYVDDINKAIWNFIEHSHRLADTLLLADRKLKESLPKDKIYKTNAEGNIIKNRYGQPIHSKEFTEKYHEALNGMVEKQLRLAIAATADLWYTAWVNAGKPDLNHFDPEPLTERNEKFYKEDIKEWRRGKIAGFKSDDEFGQ